MRGELSAPLLSGSADVLSERAEQSGHQDRSGEETVSHEGSFRVCAADQQQPYMGGMTLADTTVPGRCPGCGAASHVGECAVKLGRREGGGL